MNQNFFLYTVIFHQYSFDGEYQPIIFGKSARDIISDNNCVHMLDPDMKSILPILEYILQLPRFDLDLLELSEDIIDMAWYESHQILIVPDSIINSNNEVWNIILRDSDAVFAANDVDLSIIEITPPLGIYKCSEIGQKLLNEQWNRAYLLIQKDYNNINMLDYKPVYLSGKYLNVLPLLFLARQYGKIDEVLYKIFNTNDMEIEKACGRLLYSLILNQNVMAKLNQIFQQDYLGYDMNGSAAKQFLKENYDTVKENMKTSNHINVVVTFPGISKRQRKTSGITPFLPIEEKRAIRIMGLHRAIATNSALVELPIICDSLYQYLDHIEQELKKSAGTNNPYIWSMLRKIGNELKNQITNEQESLLLQAPYITAFSDFPLGLAILPGQQIPLSVGRSVSYQPITPLSRQIVFELSEIHQLALFCNCRILFVECIPDDVSNHSIHKISEELYSSIKCNAKGCPNVFLYHEEAYTVRDLKNVLNKFKKGTLEILIISAHGFYAEQNNLAGLWIGNEKWMANDNDFWVPPIVLLSACHVSPRGRNVVNVGDMMIRLGARVVLSTLIPVDVFRNTLIYSRLFVYIFQAFKGSNQYKTLADAWTGVIATNAINEIVESSPALKKWYFGNGTNGKPRLYDFTMHRSVGRLRSSCVYQDTITVLKEMLREDGMEGRFDSILDKNNYFPESFFYQMIGMPETILLINDISPENK